MKKYYLAFMVSFLLSCAITFAQSYSVSLTNSGNVTGSVINSYSSSVTVNFTYSGTKASSQNLWKIQVYRDMVVGVDEDISFQMVGGSGTTVYGTWVDEGTYSCSIPLIAGQSNYVAINLYEAEPNTSYSSWTLRASSSAYYNVAQKVYVQNNFGSGNVYVNSSSCASGSSFDLYSSSLSLQAIENQIDGDGYNRIWSTSSANLSCWTKNGVNVTTSTTYSYSKTYGENGVILIAYLKRECNLTSNCPLTIGSTYYSIGSNAKLIDAVPTSVTASSTFVSTDYLVRQFTSWADDNSTSATRTFTLSSNTTANVNSTVVKPDNGYKNQNNSTTVGQPITITWNEHPNTGVTAYQVWRRIKDVQANTLLATVSRGTTSYTDTECTLTSGYSDNLIYYDIRAYYSPNGTYADADYVAVFGDYTAGGGDASIASSGNSTKAASASLSVLPTEYTMANYPNPFNPTTVIKYTMPEAGEVVLKVYNMIGQEVATLVNGTMSAGSHTVNFNAKGLPTGIYIARLQTGAKVVSSKLQLVK